MSSVVTLKYNNTIKVQLNNLQSNDIITVSIDESKIVSADGNYKMSDLLAGGSDSSEEGVGRRVQSSLRFRRATTEVFG